MFRLSKSGKITREKASWRSDRGHRAFLLLRLVYIGAPGFAEAVLGFVVSTRSLVIGSRGIYSPQAGCLRWNEREVCGRARERGRERTSLPSLRLIALAGESVAIWRCCENRPTEQVYPNILLIDRFGRPQFLRCYPASRSVDVLGPGLLLPSVTVA